jgi:enoyl reductase-like protein
MKSKFNKKQLTAIDNLVYNIDELDNKPRRLFDSLQEIAESFIVEEDRKDELKTIIKRINEFERFYYMIIGLPEIAKDIMECRMETDRELFKLFEEQKNKYEEGYDNGFNNGIEESSKIYCQKMLKRLAEYYN